MQWRNFACLRTWTFAGSYVDRGHRWEENQRFLQVFERKQTCREQFWTLDGRTVGRRTVGRAADGARPPSGREPGAAKLQTFTYSNPLRG